MVACSPACIRNIALKLTSVYETSSQDLQWDVCVTLADNHGYSAGIIQFTTGTGSAQAVISKYETSLQKGTTVQQNSPFKSFDSVLSSLKDASQASGSPQGDISGLQGFCDAWKQASETPEFRDAQLQVLDDLYWTPSQITARKYSLSLPISIGQIFDSTIQLGAQGTLSLIKSIPTPSGDETKWIGDFLDARRSKLIDMGGAYAPTVTRVDSYKYILQQGEQGFVGNKVDALDNSGRVMTVECDPGVVNGSHGGIGLNGGNDGGGGDTDGDLFGSQAEEALIVYSKPIHQPPMLSFEDDDEFGDMPELPPSVSLETYKPATPPRPVLPATASSLSLSPLHQQQQQQQHQHQPAPQLDHTLDTPSLSQIQQSPEQEKPKTKRLARDVAKLDANRLLAPEGLPRLHQITKQLSLKGKKHEFDDLAHMMLTYQKWGHSVFNKLVFTSFIEGAEKVCREKRVKGWRDALVSEERRRKNGFYDDEDVVTVGGGGAGMGEKEQLDVTMADAEAIKNQVPINKALAEIDDLNREEEEEFERLVREAEAQHATNQSQPPKSTTRSMTFEDDDDDFDFDSQMREQLGVSTTTVSNSNTKNAAPTFAEEDDYEHEFNQAMSSNMMEEDDFNFDMPVDPIASVPPLINGTEDQIDSEAANPLVSSTIAPPVDTNLPSQAELDALANDFDWDGE